MPTTQTIPADEFEPPPGVNPKTHCWQDTATGRWVCSRHLECAACDKARGRFILCDGECHRSGSCLLIGYSDHIACMSVRSFVRGAGDSTSSACTSGWCPGGTGSAMFAVPPPRRRSGSARTPRASSCLLRRKLITGSSTLQREPPQWESKSMNRETRLWNLLAGRVSPPHKYQTRRTAKRSAQE